MGKKGGVREPGVAIRPTTHPIPEKVEDSGHLARTASSPEERQLATTWPKGWDVGQILVRRQHVLSW